jgi:hypothetical protein
MNGYYGKVIEMIVESVKIYLPENAVASKDYCAG